MKKKNDCQISFLKRMGGGGGGALVPQWQCLLQFSGKVLVSLEGEHVLAVLDLHEDTKWLGDLWLITFVIYRLEAI